MPNPAASQAVAPANAGSALRAACISASGDGEAQCGGCMRVSWAAWMHRRMFQRQRETNAAVRIWVGLPNQSPGEGESAVLATAIGSKGNHPAEVAAGPRKAKGPFERRFRKRQWQSVRSGCTMHAQADMQACRGTCLMDLGPVSLSWWDGSNRGDCHLLWLTAKEPLDIALQPSMAQGHQYGGSNS